MRCWSGSGLHSFLRFVCLLAAEAQAFNGEFGSRVTAARFAVIAEWLGIWM